ncbi:hypothetical protein AAT18_02710 [Rhodococcus aetherivorans]|jgi:DNA-binding CsgD family transcriptional regulator|nr:hypothetical protein AAT18_02710 [Rhodococcus aetherivorans]
MPLANARRAGDDHLMSRADTERLAAALALSARLARDDNPPDPARVLFELSACVPFAHGAISRWDAARGCHRTASSLGYPRPIVDAINRFLPRHPLFDDMLGRRLPQQLCTVPPRLRHGPVFDEVIVPQQYTDGLSQCLFAPDGRYVGMLNLSAAGGRVFDREDLVMVALLAADLACVVDPAAAPGPADRDPGRGIVLVVAASGAIDRPLDAPPEPAAAALVAAGDGLRAVAAEVRRRGRAADYLLIATGIVYDAHLAPARGGGVLVRARVVPPPDGLTVRELQVLGLVRDGASNTAIGRELGIRPSTVSTHLEHVLRKTGAANRTVAAVRAAEWKLRLVDRAAPPVLAGNAPAS